MNQISDRFRAKVTLKAHIVTEIKVLEGQGAQTIGIKRGLTNALWSVEDG